VLVPAAGAQCREGVVHEQGCPPEPELGDDGSEPVLVDRPVEAGQREDRRVDLRGDRAGLGERHRDGLTERRRRPSMPSYSQLPRLALPRPRTVPLVSQTTASVFVPPPSTPRARPALPIVRTEQPALSWRRRSQRCSTS